MKFENLSATMQNAVVNGGVIIAHGTGNFNAHLASAYKRWDNAEHLICDGCDNLAEEGTYNIIPVEMPQALMGLMDANQRILAAKSMTKRLYINAVRAGETGMGLLTILYALENGTDGDLITDNDEQWERFVVKHRAEATVIITNEKVNARGKH